MEKLIEKYLKDGGKITYIENTPENIWHLWEQNDLTPRLKAKKKYKPQMPYGKYNLLKLRYQISKRRIENFFKKNPGKPAKEAAEILGVSITQIYRHKNV